MLPVDRKFTYQDKIEVTSEDLELVRIGRKTATIRLGELDVAQENVWLTDGNDKLRIKILKVNNQRTYNQLTDQDAFLDGLESKLQLADDLRRFYGEIAPDQTMTIIEFELEDRSAHCHE
jgi:hypothetical protein